MTPADIVAAGAFFTIVIAGLIVRSVRDILRRRPAERISERMDALRDARTTAKTRRAADKPNEQKLFSFKSIQGEQGALAAWFDERRERIRTVGGSGGIRVIAISAVAASLLAFMGTSLAGLSAALVIGASIAAPLFAIRSAYAWMAARFKLRFLAVFPDTLDLIIRAVRAGIPAVQAIGTAGVESEEPVRSTFRRMGDALLLGAELKEVLEQEADRLRLADFSFFTVCLILQRETGGNLAETLENLAGIVRTRRDIRAKTKALTAEGRISSNIIAAVPFAIMGFLYVVNRPYIALLFHTRAGHKMLTLAAILLTVGLWMIRKIANLDTSR